jgi:hypothetical protein
MWEDKATTDPTNRFSEATGGQEQKRVKTKNKQIEYGQKK